VYKSSDGGATWDVSFETENGLHVWDIEEDPLNGYVYFCTENPSHVANPLLMRSEDRGGSWADIIPWNNPFGHGLKIQVHPVTQDVYFLTETQRVLYKSSDFGDTWTGKSVDINYDLIIDKNYPDRFFGSTIVSGTFVGGVYFSADTGESFSFGGLAGTTPSLALNGTSTKLLAAVGKGIYVADISQPYGPHELIEAIMSFVDASVADGTLEGVGPTKTSAAGKLHALRNMFENAGNLISSNSLEASCDQLLDAYRKTDGAARPPDLVKGTGVPKLAIMIQALMDTLACQ
jgi:hypothetical protein